MDSTHIELIETAGDAYLGVPGGMAIGQGSCAGQLTASSVTGSSYVLGITGMDRFEAVQVTGALLTLAVQWAVL